MHVDLSIEPDRAPRLPKKLRKAEERIDACVYKFDDERICKALVEALDRGVKLRIVVNRRSADESPTKDWLEKLVLKGAKVKVWRRKKKLHAKFTVIDAQRVFFGSYNWTKSAKSNTELVVAAEDAVIAERFAALFQELWSAAESL